MKRYHCGMDKRSEVNVPVDAEQKPSMSNEH